MATRAPRARPAAPSPAEVHITAGQNAPVNATVRLEDLLAQLLPAAPASPEPVGRRRRGAAAPTPGPADTAQASGALAALVDALRAARAAAQPTAPAPGRSSGRRSTATRR